MSTVRPKMRGSLLLCSALLLALGGCKRSRTKHAPFKSASLAQDPDAFSEEGGQFWAPAYRDGVLVIDGDILVKQKLPGQYGIVHYGKAWPGARVPFRFSKDPEFKGDHDSRERVRDAIERIRRRTKIDWVELDPDRKDPEAFVEIRFWEKGWGSAQVGFVGEKQLVNLPDMPSIRLTLHELGHVMGLGHEHQHPMRDKFVKVDRDCVPKEHRGSFAPRSKHVVSRTYDIDSIMHYRSAGFCRKDTVDADDDGNTRECAYVDDDPEKGKCYALRRFWGACSRGNCEDRDGDGFREYIRGSGTLSEGDVQTIHSLHRQMLSPSWPSASFGRSMVATDGDGDGEIEIYVAAMEDGPCGALWELRPDSSKTALVRHQSTPARWRCDADRGARLQLGAMWGQPGGQSELWVGISGPSTRPRGGWVEQWQRGESGEMKVLRRLSAQNWNMSSTDSFGHSLAVLDRDGDGRADDVAIGSPGRTSSGRVFYAQGVRLDGDSEPWAKVMGQLAGSADVGQTMSWLYRGKDASLVLGVGCTASDGPDCKVSLWRWSSQSSLSKLFDEEEFGLAPVREPLSVRAASYGGGQGLWWMMPNACLAQDMHRGACGVAWPFHPWGERLTLAGMPLIPGSKSRVEIGEDGFIPLHSTQGPAMIVKSVGGKAWVITQRAGEQHWVELPPPRALAPGQSRDFTGWWDKRGLFVVSAWTDLGGKRHVDLQKVAQESPAAR